MKNLLSNVVIATLLLLVMGFALHFKSSHLYAFEFVKAAPVSLASIILVLAIAAISSWFISYMVIRYEHLHAHLSHDHIDSGPQKTHAEPAPRIGGIGMFGGLLAAVWVAPIISAEPPQFERAFSYLFLAATPAFIGGIVEDITKNVGVIQRLLLTMLSGAIGAWLLGGSINRLDIPFLDHALNWLPIAIIFTVFAVAGVANSINIIDGYNGLASGFATIILAAMAYVAWLVNDHLVLMASVSTAGVMLGFLSLNWPKGKIFMGDGGAYLLGFILAELSVLLISRNPSVSPWFPLVLLGYPVFETLYSIYRRKWLHQTTTGHPDALHFHQLLFKWIVRHNIRTGQPILTTKNNSRVAPYLWLPTLLCALFGVLFWQSTIVLMLGMLFGCLVYVILYTKLAKLKFSVKELSLIKETLHDETLNEENLEIAFQNSAQNYKKTIP